MPYDENLKTKKVGEYVMCPFVQSKGTPSLVGREICNENCQHFLGIVENGSRNFVRCQFPVIRNFVTMETLDNG